MKIIILLTFAILSNLNALINISNSTYCTKLDSRNYKFTQSIYTIRV